MTQDTSNTENIGVLLINLGTPDAPNKKAVRAYLKEFLSDPRVIKLPKLLWWPMLNFVILNTRPKHSTKAYQKVWTEQGSPLLNISKQQASALQSEMLKTDDKVKVILAMRYGQPSIEQAMTAFHEAGIKRILVFPLYPQFSATTTASCFDAVAKSLKASNDLPELRFINRYYEHPAYIKSLANSVRKHWQEHGRAEKLLMSFHGIPQDYVTDGDPYPDECQKTGALLAAALQLSPEQWMLTFQSRLGPRQWMQPYTDITLKALPQSGVKNIDLICPGFSADCLETLEEIAIDNKNVFMQAGGEQYQYIPCLNARPDHIKLMANIIKQHCKGWLD